MQVVAIRMELRVYRMASVYGVAAVLNLLAARRLSETVGEDDWLECCVFGGVRKMVCRKPKDLTGDILILSRHLHFAMAGFAACDIDCAVKVEEVVGCRKQMAAKVAGMWHRDTPTVLKFALPLGLNVEVLFLQYGDGTHDDDYRVIQPSLAHLWICLCQSYHRPQSRYAWGTRQRRVV